MNRWRALLPAKLGTIFLALALAGVVGWVEYATGYDFHLTALFLVPICWAAWVVGRRAGWLLAVVCTVIWLVADLATGHPYKHPVIPYWNALMLLAFFVVIVFAFSGFQDEHQKLLAARSLLEHQNERLEQTVQQRTSALQSEIAERKRLEQANLQAERLAMVGTIAAEVAHEVRNPLGSIKLNLDLIGKQIETLAETSRHPAEEGRTLVHEMREEVHRIQHVIEDYLRFARLRNPQRKPVFRQHRKLPSVATNVKGSDSSIPVEGHTGGTRRTVDRVHLHGKRARQVDFQQPAGDHASGIFEAVGFVGISARQVRNDKRAD